MSEQVPSPEHPGCYVKQKMLAQNWCQEDIVSITLWSRSSVSNLITGKADVNAKRAIVLDQVFDDESLGPMYWINLQAVYDLWRAGYRGES